MKTNYLRSVVARDEQRLQRDESCFLDKRVSGSTTAAAITCGIREYATTEIFRARPLSSADGILKH